MEALIAIAALVARAWRGRPDDPRGWEGEVRQWWRLAATASPRLPWRVVAVSLSPIEGRRVPHHVFGR